MTMIDHITSRPKSIFSREQALQFAQQRGYWPDESAMGAGVSYTQITGPETKSPPGWMWYKMPDGEVLLCNQWRMNPIKHDEVLAKTWRPINA